MIPRTSNRRAATLLTCVVATWAAASLLFPGRTYWASSETVGPVGPLQEPVISTVRPGTNANSPAPLLTYSEKLMTLSFMIAAFLAAFSTVLRNNSWFRPDSGAMFYSMASAGFAGASFLGAYSSYSLNANLAPGFLFLGGALLLITFTLFLRTFWRVYVRTRFLHEGKGSRKFFVINRVWRYLRPKSKRYEFDVEPREDWSLADWERLFFGMSSDAFNSLRDGGSVLVKVPNIHSARKELASFVASRLAAGDTVNYVTVVDSPFRIMEILRSKQAVQLQRLVFIDVFSDIFGFADDILLDFSTRMTEEHASRVVRTNTCAGLHRALKEAFNILKQERRESGVTENKKRLPCLMIYDSLSAFSLADSEEQVRTFVHHMIAAERSYKMVTFLLEHENAKGPVYDTMEALVDHVVKWNNSSETDDPEVKATQGRKTT